MSMRPSSRSLPFLVPLVAVTTVFAQEAPKIDQTKSLEKFRQEVEENRKRMFVPGAAVAIIKDDKVVLITGLGYKDVKNKKPVTADTLFAIGSTTKAFTSMLMAMAVDEGKVKFTDSPKKYLPYFRMYDPETDAKITISDIMSHRSGLPRTDMIMLGQNLTTEDMIWNVTRAKPTAKLGEKWQYQNIMFVAAGEIEKHVFGSPWQQLVKDRIFQPLGMTHSNTSVPETLNNPERSLGYDGSPAMNELPMRNIDVVGPAGAINSSARDMAEWVRFLLRKGELNGKSLVSASSYDELFKPHQAIGNGNSYGYGWMLRDWNGHKVIEHGGNIDGFNAQVAMMPDQNLGMVMLTNVSGSGLPQSAMTSLWKNLVGEPGSTEKVAALVDPDKEVGTYHNDQIKMDVVVTHEGDKLFGKPSGQPKMELIPLGDRKYKIGPPAPDKVYVTFAPDKDDPKITTAKLDQGGMSFIFKPAKPYEASIAVEELITKEIAAMGGADNIAKIKSLSYRYTYDMETQGLKASGLVTKLAPNLGSDMSVYSTASGTRIGWDRSAYNGTSAAYESSFGPTQPLVGADLVDLANMVALSQELDWRTRFEKVAVTGEDKVDGEEAYVVEKSPKVGNKVTDYISKKSFMLLKRVSGAGPGAVTDVYKDYSLMEGVQLPMRIIRDSAQTGKGPVTIYDVKINGPVDKALLKVKA